jgi:hypothetical protein
VKGKGCGKAAQPNPPPASSAFRSIANTSAAVAGRRSLSITTFTLNKHTHALACESTQGRRISAQQASRQARPRLGIFLFFFFFYLFLFAMSEELSWNGAVS